MLQNLGKGFISNIYAKLSEELGQNEFLVCFQRTLLLIST